MLKWVKSNGKEYAPIVLRLGVCFVFLWFGIMQLLKTENFTGYLPEFLYDSPYANALVIGNGVFEIIFGTLLLIGLFTRLSAFLLGLHLLSLSIDFMIRFGFTNEVFARDIGLTIATFAVFLYGADKWCYDAKKKSSS